MRRPAAASMRSSREAMRSLTPARASPDSRSSSSAARSSAPAPSRPRRSSAASSQLRACPSAPIAARKARRASTSSIALASQIVQVSTEAKTSPIITALTTMSAARNMPQGERSRGNCSAIAGSDAAGAQAAAGKASKTAAAAAGLTSFRMRENRFILPRLRAPSAS